MHTDNRRSLKASAAAIACLAANVVAVSEAAAQAPTREEIRRDRLDEQLRTTGEGVAVDVDLARAPCVLDDPRYADIRFTLAGVNFAGAEAVEPGLLEQSWSDLAGQDLQIAEVCRIRDRATQLLNDAGYVASVQVPPQTIDDGVVRFDVVVARITGLVVRGEPGPSGAMLRRYFEKLRAEPVFRKPQAERILLLARDIPGLDVRLSLARDVGDDARPGDLIGIIDVVGQRFVADLNIQNYSPKSTGRFGGLARAQLNGLTGLADLTEVSVYSSQDPSEQLVLQGRHEFGIGTNGLRFGVSAVHAWSQPDVAGPDVFDTTTFIGTAYASFPLVRRQTRNLGIVVGFDWIDQQIEFNDLELSKDKLRVPFVRLVGSAIDRASAEGRGGYNIAEPRFAASATLEARQGISALGASDDCQPNILVCLFGTSISRLDADPTSFVLRGDAQVDFRPSPKFLISLAPRFQYASGALLPYEQFSGGNFTVGRGYDPGDVVGDSGVGLRAEAAFGSLQPETPNGIAWQPFVFFDTLAAWTKNVPDDPVTLNSVGAGVRFNIARRAFLEVLGALPLERAPLDLERGDARLLVNLTVSFGS